MRDDETVSPEEVAKWTRRLANAAVAARKRDLHRQHHDIAKALGASLTDEEERAIFDATFRGVPVPE